MNGQTMLNLASIGISAHKYFAPPEFKGSIRRDAILDRIFSEPGLRAILIQGPAGHGKSTLLQQAKSASEAAGAVTAWLTFDEADNDTRRFYLHLQALLARISPNEKCPELPELEDSGGIGLLRPMEWFINGLLEAGKPVSLFFDEFQYLSDKTILGFFREMLAHVPENVRIFIGSRTVPEVGFARLMVNNRAFVFRTDDLRFTLTEVNAFFSSMQDIQIRNDEIEAIFAQTEGWPAALQLFRLALVSPSVRRSLRDFKTFRPPELAEYLADYVLALQSPAVQDFLRKISPLTRLCAPLCDAVTGWNRSQETLVFLERSGLFVRSLDSEERWFRLHSLFSSFLQEQLRQTSKEAVTDVHRRAARWYQEHAMFDEAMYHAVAAREYALAADTMEAWSSDLIAKGHLMTVERWYERLPLPEVEKRPDLAVKIAWSLTFLRRQSKLAPILRILERSDAGFAKPVATNPQIVLAMAAILVDDLPRSFETILPVGVLGRNPEGFAAFELGAAANLQSYFCQASGDFETSRELLAFSRTCSDLAGASFSLGYAHANAGINLILQGRLKEALAAYRAGTNDARIRLSESIAGASLVSCYIQALYEANEVDAAEAQFNEFREIIAKATLLDYLCVAYITMSRIDDLRGRPERASALLDEAESIGFANGLPRLVRIVNWERIRRLLLNDEVEQASTLASRILTVADGPALPEGWIPFSEDTECVAIGHCRLAIYSGNPDEGLSHISAELDNARRTGRIRRQIKLHVLEALAYGRKGDTETGRRCLRDALRLAITRGFIRTILDEGTPVVQLLQQEYDLLSTERNAGEAQRSMREFIKKLLNLPEMEMQIADVTAQFPPLEPLTRREIDILAFVASGVSNKEIARQTFVSENTVKFHLKNAYSKLGVTSRLQAINAARRMALI